MTEDMNQYQNVQNYQLFQQILDEEKKKEEADSETWLVGGNFGWTISTPETREKERQQAFSTRVDTITKGLLREQRKKAYRTNTNNEPQPQIRPKTAWETMSKEDQEKITSTNLYNVFNRVQEEERREQQQQKEEPAFHVEGKGDKPLSEDDPNYELYHDPFAMQEPVVDDQGNIIREDQDLLQEALTGQYQQEREEAYEQTHDPVKAIVEDGISDVEQCLEDGIPKDLVTQDLALNYVNGYMSEVEKAALSRDQRRVIEAWSKLNMAYETAKDYIFMKGEYGEYTKEYLKELEQQMDRLITFESRAEEKLEYYSCEFLYGLFEAVETGWDYVVSGIAWLGAHNGAPMILAFYGEDAYQKHLDYWDKKAEGILTDNWSRRQREQNARNHSASAFERKVGELVGAFGGMVPISIVSAINPVAGAAMSGLNTAGKTSRDAIESGNGIGDALAYGLVAGSVDFALNALSSTAFQARGAKGASWGEKFISRVAKTEGGDLALRTIAGTLVDTGADTFSLLVQHNIKKMYDPNYKETLSEEEVLKTIAVSLVVNGGMRLGTNISKGVYETDADGMLKPLDEARMMDQMPKGADEPKIMDMEGDESGGLSGMFQEVDAEKPGVEIKGLEIEAEPSSVKVEGDDIMNKNRIEIIDPDNKQFKIVQWDDYPDDIVPMPDQNKAWVLLEDDNYQNARKQANKANRAFRKGDSDYFSKNNIEIHEIEPVKFGGDPISPNNKVGIQASAHRQVVTPWWNRIQKEAEEEFKKLSFGGLEG
ncbi:hypothetical protein AALG83_03720 [Christensenellaceae bacterium 44-20]